MTDKDKKSEIDIINMELVEFSIYTITFLTNSICKTCCKQAIDNFIKFSNNNFITSLMIKKDDRSTINIDEFSTICRY